MAIKISGNTIIDDNRCLINYGVVHNALGNVSGATTINLQLGNYVSATATGNITWTFSNPVPAANACGFIFELTDGGNHTMTWPNTVRWPNSIAPTLSTNGIDVLVFITDNAGSDWRGALAMKNSV